MQLYETQTQTGHLLSKHHNIIDKETPTSYK